MLHDMQNIDEQMVELTEDELIEVKGDGFGSCGGCGFGFGPFITAFTNQCANTFAASQSVAASNVNRNSYFTLFN